MGQEERYYPTWVILFWMDGPFSELAESLQTDDIYTVTCAAQRLTESALNIKYEGDSFESDLMRIALAIADWDEIAQHIIKKRGKKNYV